MSSSDRLPLDGPKAWMGKTMSAHPNWNYNLSTRELEAIDRSVKRLRNAGATLKDIAPGDFPLDSFADQIASIRRDLDTGPGFAVIRGLTPDRYTMSSSR